MSKNEHFGEEALKGLLSKKLNDQTEIEIHLFEFCNLSCKFCGQDHDSKVGFDTINEKADDAIAFMKRSHLNSHIVNVMGGEVFNDLVPDELFEKYSEFCNAILDFGSNNGQDITINWVTNLIFNKKNRVKGLISKFRDQGHKVNISTSYDFDGRGYAGKANSLFAKNLAEFKDWVYTIGFVLTSPAIKNFMEKHDPFFEKMYQEHVLYFDYYVPEERNCDELMPSDGELLEAFIYAATHYPNVYPVRDWLNNESNKMTCYSLNKLTVLPDGEHVTCRYLSYRPGSFKNPIDYKSNANIISSFAQENECLSCQWYERCSMRCFVQADWAKREKLDGCLYKKFFDQMVGGQWT